MLIIVPRKGKPHAFLPMQIIRLQLPGLCSRRFPHIKYPLTLDQAKDHLQKTSPTSPSTHLPPRQRFSRLGLSLCPLVSPL